MMYYYFHMLLQLKEMPDMSQKGTRGKRNYKPPNCNKIISRRVQVFFPCLHKKCWIKQGKQ